MTGWRLATQSHQQNWRDTFDFVHRTFNGALNTFVQDAAITALNTPKDVLIEMRNSYQRRRDLVVESFVDHA